VSSVSAPEIVFVVDVSSFTKEGFTGSTEYEGKQLNVSFDDMGEGATLTSEMAKRLHVRKGSRLSFVVEGESTIVGDLVVRGVGKNPRVSDARVYYAVGKEGGAVVKIRSA